jgi:hypothetical protein
MRVDRVVVRFLVHLLIVNPIVRSDKWKVAEMKAKVQL